MKEILTESGLPAVPEEIEVRDAIEAEQLCFPGSPTVRVDGEDIEAGVQDRREYTLSCRMYKTAGIPPRKLLLATFRRGGRSASPGRLCSPSIARAETMSNPDPVRVHVIAGGFPPGSPAGPRPSDDSIGRKGHYQNPTPPPKRLIRSKRRTARIQAGPCIVCGGQSVFLFSKANHDIFRCKVCGLGSVTPVRTAAELRELYENAYYNSGNDLGYSSQYGELEVGLKKTYRQILGRVERLQPGRRFERILDVGCAYGFFLDAVEERWHPLSVVGIDLTREAQHRNQAKGRTFYSGFFQEVDLPDAYFDFIFVGDTFEHMHDPLAVVTKFRRILAPDGIVLITTVDFGSWIARLLGARWRLMTPPEHLYFWTRDSLTKVFADRGFSAKLGKYFLFYPRSYVYQTAKAQFGFTPYFLGLVPGNLIPIPSFDVLMGIFRKRD